MSENNNNNNSINAELIAAMAAACARVSESQMKHQSEIHKMNLEETRATREAIFSALAAAVPFLIKEMKEIVKEEREFRLEMQKREAESERELQELKLKTAAASSGKVKPGKKSKAKLYNEDDLDEEDQELDDMIDDLENGSGDYLKS